MGRRSARVWVSGRVQGVMFRESTRQRALELGLDGWVRNLLDGRVEALLSGDESAVRAALAFVRAGPRFAVVEDVVIEWGEPVEEGSGFDVRF